MCVFHICILSFLFMAEIVLWHAADDTCSSQQINARVEEATAIDPYEIMRTNFLRTGVPTGAPTFSSRQMKWHVTFAYSGREAIVDYWEKYPALYRYSLDFGDETKISGSDGMVSWYLEKGCVSVDSSETARQECELRAWLNSGKLLDRSFHQLSLSYRGVERVRGNFCYVVQVDNKFGSEQVLHYIDTCTYLEIQTLTRKGADSSLQIHSDFSNFGAVVLPRRTTWKYLPSGDSTVMQLESYDSGVSLDDSLFVVPRTPDTCKAPCK